MYASKQQQIDLDIGTFSFLCTVYHRFVYYTVVYISI